MKRIFCLVMLCIMLAHAAQSQVDSSFIYSTTMPYGTLDIRLAKSASRYYYLQENKTFSYRESTPGVRTNTFRDMTSWDSSPYAQGNLREKNGTLDYFIMNYRLLFPSNYDPLYAEGYPLIVMVHGAGERANCWDNSCFFADRRWNPNTNTPAAPKTATHELLNNDLNLLHGGEVHLRARNLAGARLPNDPSMPARAFPGFVLFPQNLNGWDVNTAQDAIRLIRLITKKYKIDQNRIYIHGLSNGGYGTFELVKRAPWLFTAALPMSAIADAGASSNPGISESIGSVPFWVFQGGIDTNPTPAKTKGIVKRLRDAGITVRYTEYSNLGHGVWNTAYNEPDFFTWMLAQHKSAIHAFADVPAICKTTGQGAKLQLSNGFRAYQWEKDGIIIHDANANVYVANEPGVYRARFSRVANPSETDWNRWSDPVTVTESNPEPAQVVQKGSIRLKGLDNYGNAHLGAVGEFEHYYWYKDGSLYDFSGTQDDTVKNPIFKQGVCTNLPTCTGNGVYTLVTAGADLCPSPPSPSFRIYFNNQAPLTITAPGNFTGNATSPSSAVMTWTDLSGNETGFEIWRRKVNPDKSLGIWRMAGLTSSNANTFTDERLEPNITYQYKLRAVGETGRSNYTPSAGNQFLLIKTQPDISAPSAPTNLVAEKSGIREITLSWGSSLDDTGIRQYLVFVNDDTIATTKAITKLTLSDLELNTNYRFSVKAEDLGGNISESTNFVDSDTYMAGLYYEHSTGAWSDLDQINWSIAEFKGKVDNVTLDPRTQEDYFNFQFKGFLYLNTSGVYQFRTTSDDGSRLTLNDTIIVDNDGLHGNVTKTSGDMQLEAGAHAINVKFFEYGGGQTLIVQYKGPDTDNNWINIPDAALTSGSPETTALLAASLSDEVSHSSTALQASVFPNPSDGKGTLTIRVEGATRDVMVRLIDLTGTQYFEKIISPEEIPEHQLQLPVSLNKGFYILLVNDGEQTLQERIIIRD